jgi:tetratricopeptide (TPR) repeat protein
MNKVFLIVIGLSLAGAVFGTRLLLESDRPLDLFDPKLYSSLGNFLFKEGMTGNAIAAYEKSIELDGDDPMVLNNLGVSYLESDVKKAESYFREALRHDPMYVMARKNLAVLQSNQGKYRDAIANYRELIDSNPDNVEYLYDLAVNLGNQFYHESRDVSDLDEALRLYKKVNELSPGFMHTQENIKVLNEVKALISS